MYSLAKYTDTGEILSPLSGKVPALMATGGGAMENNLELLERQWKNPADMIGCTFLSCLFPDTPPEPGVLIKNDTAQAKAKKSNNRPLRDIMLYCANLKKKMI